MKKSIIDTLKLASLIVIETFKWTTLAVLVFICILQIANYIYSFRMTAETYCMKQTVVEINSVDYEFEKFVAIRWNMGTKKIVYIDERSRIFFETSEEAKKFYEELINLGYFASLNDSETQHVVLHNLGFSQAETPDITNIYRYVEYQEKNNGWDCPY